MLKGAAVPRLSHILIYVRKNNHTVEMTKMDGAHRSTWLHCLTASEDTEHVMGPEGRGNLSELLDLPASYGGAGLYSLVASADEEFLGSFAGIAATLISFCKNTEVSVCTGIAEALERTKDPDAGTGCPTTNGVKAVYEKMANMRDPLSADESKATTELDREGRSVEVPGAYDPEKPDSGPEPFTLPEPRLISDYTTAPLGGYGLGGYGLGGYGLHGVGR